MLDVRSFRGGDCVRDYYLVVAKFRERLAISKQRARKYEEERVYLRKLNKLVDRKQYQIEISIGLQLRRT